MHTHALLAALLAPATVSAQLNSLAVAAGLKYFGTAVREGSVSSDSAYMAIVNNKNELGQVVSENGQKWDATEPSRNTFTYTQGDIVPNVAKKNGQYLRCHTLTWHSQLPSWVSSGSWTRATLQPVIETHISNVMAHYLGQCYAWDVVNEAIADDGTWRDSVFYRTFSTDFLAISFNAAKKADPNTKLYYNDYNLEYNGAKTERALEVVNIIQKAGAPIDGVGFQAHLIVGSTPSRSSLATVLKRFTALNVEVAYTELDIRHSSLPASTSALATQGNDFANVVGSCLDVTGCVGVTVWGFTDKYSWVPSTFSGAGDALIYDSNLNKKAAWTSISSVLAAKATNPVTLVTSTKATTATSVAATTTPVVVVTTTSSAPATTSTASGGAEAAHWAQCGGTGWTGATKCQSPWTCKVSNPYYSQCL
ncbi:endo-1,4-beta-xylanase Z [Bombardia bombarda]|uniref:Beta-xylanase n=1 Tax=Bombardia bombarda TaxID=252184 RepID=A0AA39TH30_9PEZI|nr:endo-1,4-beta-xylanase Z [Bombardia bombarda]